MKKQLFAIAAFLLSASAVFAQAPIIGISSYNGSDACSADLTYINSVRLAGGIPVVIPLTTDEAELEKTLSLVDGVIMTGGADYDPLVWYGEEPVREMRGVQPERDAYDVMMVRKAVEKGLPVLGICRGEQLLAVAFKGSLWQDVPSMLKGNVKHNQMPTDVRYATHSVTIEKSSELYRLVGKEKPQVNSFHHQGIKALPKGLKASAHSADGLIEAVERDGKLEGFKDAGAWILGVQFHPECLITLGGDKTFLPIFEELVRQSAARAGK